MSDLTAQAIVIREHGGPEVLRLEDVQSVLPARVNCAFGRLR